MEEDLGGIDKEHGHPRALQIIPDEFFWDCTDELAPFGSDEGDTALHEYREWRKHHPGEPLEDCIVWTIESVGEMEVSEYSDAIFNESTVREQIEDPDFDDQQYIFTTDVSVLATAFGQLADEGTIDASAKPYVARALKRQAVWARLQPDWAYTDEYLHKLSRLQAALDVA
ncbi:uncharacterized protein YfeS [Xanthomonas sp. JAI131]|uniref:hypothetical protein n=1 Tax=Xanthomonas sp. JAI131 TaxID=2723067 RepID=UPI0015CADA43|nr:hypothetical protein [Xanthomonas sp. JAI131]NYF22319.1 uncharacterized protein YfeS [Xanthomonas sp. JAI131]